MRFALLAPLLAGLLLALACAPEEDVITQDIVSTIPWPDQERAEYILLDRDGEEEVGRGVLTGTRRGGGAGGGGGGGGEREGGEGGRAAPPPPPGTYQAWRLEIRSSRGKHVAWF